MVANSKTEVALRKVHQRTEQNSVLFEHSADHQSCSFWGNVGPCQCEQNYVSVLGESFGQSICFVANTQTDAHDLSFSSTEN